MRKGGKLWEDCGKIVEIAEKLGKIAEISMRLRISTSPRPEEQPSPESVATLKMKND